jgi:hypothetical protein
MQKSHNSQPGNILAQGSAPTPGPHDRKQERGYQIYQGRR